MHAFCVNPHTREVFLHSCIDTDAEDEPGIDYKMAVMFEKNMTYLHSQNDKPIFIHMHSPGGSWNDGWAIYDTIKHSKCYITVLAYAHASSMSSIILQAADLRLLLPNTEVLIHYGSFAVDDTTVGVQSYVNAHKKSVNLMLNTYINKCQYAPFFVEKHKTNGAIRQFLHRKITNKQDWFLTAEEAVFYGFADNVVGCDKYPNITSCIQ